MTRTFLAKTLTALLVGVLAVNLASSARADFTLQVTDQADPNHPFNFHTTGGLLHEVINASNGYTITIDATSTRPTQGATDPAIITVTTNIKGGTGNDKFGISAQDNFTNPVGGTRQLYSILSVTSLGAGDSIKLKGTFQNSHNGNATGPIISTAPLTATGPNPNPLQQTAKMNVPSGEFSLAAVEFDAFVGGSGNDIFTAQSIVAVPAPPALIMALCGMPAFGVVLWGRRKKTQPSAQPAV